MRLDSRSGVRGMLMNAETNQVVRFVIWADIPENPLEQGAFEAFRTEPKAWKAQGFPLSEIRYSGRCRLRFIPAAPRIGVKPTSPRDLSGSLSEARKRLVEPKLLIPGEECDEPGCHLLSQWRVSDEQEIEPERDADGTYHERAVTRRVRSYCSRHFRNPTFTSIRDVQSEVKTETRPQ